MIGRGLAGLTLLLAVAGCRDRELDPFRAALDAYDDGREALERGDPGTAARHFADAMASDPSSASLPAWRARALEQAGRHAEALDLLNAAVARLPAEPTLRYNRAAYRARHGDLAGAATDLRYLIDRKLLDPLDAGADPDFAALAADPATAALAPPQQVALQLRGEGGAVLLGDSWTLTLDVLAPADASVTVSDLGETSGLLRLERVVEDLTPAGSRQVLHRLSVSWRGVRPGDGRMGPWLVAAGGTSALTEPLPVSVVALGDDPQPPPLERETLWSPAARFADYGPLWAGRDGADLVWLAPPGSSVAVDGPDLPDPIEIELRDDGQPRWVGQLYPGAGAAQVTVKRGGRVVLTTDVPTD